MEPLVVADDEFNFTATARMRGVNKEIVVCLLGVLLIVSWVHLKAIDHTILLGSSEHENINVKRKVDGYYPPLPRATYKSPLWNSNDEEEPWNMYGPRCGYMFGIACNSRADQAHPGGDLNQNIETTSTIYPKSTGRLLPGAANWTDLIISREAFNYPGDWRGQQYLNSVRDWERALREYSDLVGRVPGMAAGLRTLYNSGKSNYYAAYRNWYHKLVLAQNGSISWADTVQPQLDWERRRKAWTQAPLQKDTTSSATHKSTKSRPYGQEMYWDWLRKAPDWPDELRKRLPAAEHWATRWKREAAGMGRRRGHHGWKNRPARWHGVEGENWPVHRWDEFGGTRSHGAWQNLTAAATNPLAQHWPAPVSRHGARSVGSSGKAADFGADGPWCDDLLPYCAGPANPPRSATHRLAVNCGNILPYCAQRYQHLQPDDGGGKPPPPSFRFEQDGPWRRPQDGSWGVIDGEEAENNAEFV